MDKQYELYCLADPLFYDLPDRGRAAEASAEFTVVSRDLPGDWRGVVNGEWLMCRSPVRIPRQGWKIHVSAGAGNADDVLARVWDYCVPRRISFKLLRGRLYQHMRNAKYAHRGESGKLVTIYPVDVAQCQLICEELGAILSGEPGPYVLSDLRIGDGPLYVRYGGFADRHCEDETGELVPAFEDPSGTLVPDRRNAVFTVPSWVSLPEFLAPHLARRNAASVAELPYRFERALHFSNGGGVYAAVDVRTGDRVVIKEARPHAGLAADGADAVARLQREHDILRRLAGLPVVPGVRDYFELDGHHLMVEDLVEGQPLNSFFATTHPYLDPEPDRARIAAYAEWAQRIYRRVEQAVAAIHDRGVVFNDLHVFNVMVRPDETVALIDFEGAALLHEGRRPTIGNPGFVAPRDRAGFAIDRYSLACLRLALFAPLTTLIAVDRSKAAHLAEIIAELFPVDREFLLEAVREIHGVQAGTAAGNGSSPRSLAFEPHPGDWERQRDGLARAILASATPARDDRLFPGDVRQFEPGGGLSLACGAAGVLYALAMTGCRRPPEHEEWLLARAARPAPGTRLGLYDGLLGVAYVLERLGHREPALRIVEICLAERWQELGLDLHGGLAGVGLVLAHLGAVTGESVLRSAALQAADVVAARSRANRAGGEEDRAGRRAGLLHGGAGRALLFIRLHEATGDAGHLDEAARALQSDLDRCVLDRNGALHVDQGWRLMPYLGLGGAGIGCVLEDYLAHREDEHFAEAAAAARRVAHTPYYAEPGLLYGRAGMLLHLGRGHAPGTAWRDLRVAAQVRRLAWHAVAYGGGTAFPGEHLYRLSMDLGSGTAGVLLGLGAVLSPEPVHLPFLPPLDVASAIHPRRPSGEPSHQETRR